MSENLEQAAERFCEEASCVVILALDKDGNPVCKASNPQLAIPIIAAQKQTLRPKQILELVQMLEQLMKEERKPGRGRKPKQVKPADKPAEKPAEAKAS